MKRFVFFKLYLLIFIMAWPALGLAQKCDPTADAIMNFETPEVVSSSVWNRTYGERSHIESFVSGFTTQDHTTIVAGFQNDVGGKDYQLVLMALDRRGREDWTQRHSVNGLFDVVKTLPVGENFWVLGRQKKDKGGEQAWLGLFNNSGEMIDSHVIVDKSVDIVPTDIIAAHGDHGALVSVKLDAEEEGGAEGSRIYYLDSKGRVKDKESFIFGAGNMIEGLARVGEDRYAASGRVRDTHGRWAGWLMLLNDNGSLAWQRVYSRGSAATLSEVAELPDGRLIVGGIARPAVKNGRRGGWVMAINQEQGDIYWQRYYVGPTDYVTRDFVVHDDGLISVLLAVDDDRLHGQKVDNEIGYLGAPHAHLLTLSPRGDIFNDNSYFDGYGVWPQSMFVSYNKGLMVVGGAQMEPSTALPSYGVSGQDYWAMTTIPLDPYDDPCKNLYSYEP